jgi:hypothetical protein
MQGTAGVDLISRYAKLPSDVVLRVLSDLTDADQCDGCAWVERNGDGFRVAGVLRDGEASTGGFRALEESISAPFLTELNSQRWVDEALTGITYNGRETRIRNAVIPRCMRQTR